jgi:hypothetical protein
MADVKLMFACGGYDRMEPLRVGRVKPDLGRGGIMELDDLGETTASRSLPGDKFKVRSSTSSIDSIFLEAGVDETSLGELQKNGGLPRFVRTLVGLDQQAAKHFAELLDSKKLMLSLLGHSPLRRRVCKRRLAP